MSLFDGLRQAAEVFYTHAAVLHKPETKKTPMGDRYAAPGEMLGAIACNIQPITCEAAQRAYGVEIAEGWRLSCPADERIKPGVFALWNGGAYRVKAALHHPSHTSALIAREEGPGEG